MWVNVLQFCHAVRFLNTTFKQRPQLIMSLFLSKQYKNLEKAYSISAYDDLSRQREEQLKPNRRSQDFSSLTLLPTLLACLLSYRNHWSARTTKSTTLLRPRVAAACVCLLPIFPSQWAHSQSLSTDSDRGWGGQIPSVGPKWTPTSILSLLIISFPLQLLSWCLEFCLIYLNVFYSYPLSVRDFLYVRKHRPMHCSCKLPVSYAH